MRFGEKLKQMVDRASSEIGQELGRLGVQGSAELGSALFNGSAYVPYGRGKTEMVRCITWRAFTAMKSPKCSRRMTGVRCSSFFLF